MKKYLNLIILLPALIYLLFLVINYNILSETTTVSFFGFLASDLPLILIISLFFILYIIILWGLFKFSNFFSESKTQKQEGEINKLKATLQDGQGDLISDMKNSFGELIEKMNTENRENIKSLKRENDKILGNLELEIKSMKDKLEKKEKNID